MKVNELRIGNYVINSNPNLVDELKNVTLIVYETKLVPYSLHTGITGVLDVKTLDDKYDLIEYDKFISPIPITKEWLLKFGFMNNSMSFQGGELTLVDDELVISSEIGGNCTDFSFPCKYVHQLQNIYFALTGNELQCVELAEQ